MGDSLKQVKSFPEYVRRDIGSSLYDVQQGDKPDNAKPFKGVGTGIFEIVTRFDSDTYRTVYAVQIGQHKTERFWLSLQMGRILRNFLSNNLRFAHFFRS